MSNAKTTNQGQTMNADIKPGQGGTYSIGTDVYPVTVVGVSATGKTVWYRKAKPFGAGNGAHLFVDDTSAEVNRATMRKCGSFKPSGSRCGFLHFGKYGFSLDPSF